METRHVSSHLLSNANYGHQCTYLRRYCNHRFGATWATRAEPGTCTPGGTLCHLKFSVAHIETQAIFKPTELHCIMSSYSTVKTANWRFVELGRVVLVNETKQLATIVEIINQRRVLIDGPNVQRQAISLAQVVLTPIVLPNLPRGVRTGTVTKKWAAADIDNKWAATSWAKKIAAKERRAQLSDFERFQVLVLKKQRRYAVKKAVAKA